jgi:YVTN family beta-propeller protein
MIPESAVRRARSFLVILVLGPACALAAPFAYLAQPSPTNAVRVLDTASNSIVATIPVATDPVGVTVSPVGNRAYVASGGANIVNAIDTTTNTVVASIPVALGPLAMVVNPAGTRLYVTHIGNSSARGNTVSVINTASNAVVSTITVGTGPFGIAINPAGTRVYVTAYESNTISVINTATNVVVATIPTSPGPTGIVVNAAGTRAYVAMSGSNSVAGNMVAVVDLGANTVIGTIPAGTGPFSLALNPAGTRLLVGNVTSENITVIDPATATVVTTIPLASEPWGIALVPDGSRAYVVLLTGGGLVSISMSTFAVTSHLSEEYSSLGNFIGPASPGGGTTPTLPGALSGLWWNPNESGWGVHFTQRGNNIFAAWYTYDTSGNPKWYVASNCAGAGSTSGTCSGTLYEVSGPVFFGTTFNPSLVNAVATGSLQVSFQGTGNALMSYTVAGQSRTVPIVRQPLGSGSIPGVDYTDLWWNPNESGWGMAMAQQGTNLFLAWYVYDNAGSPVWYVASNCAVSGAGCSGTLYRTTGPPFGPTFDPSAVAAFAVGSVSVAFSDANNGTLTYTVNGVAGGKAITRQAF